MRPKQRRRTALFAKTDWPDTLAIRAMRLGDAFVTRMTAFLTEFGITPLQYNVLRILYVRDVDGDGLPVGVIGAGLVTATPDVTRLIDRLEQGGFIERIRKADDRRVVRVRLKDEGFALVEKIHGPLVAHHNALLAGIPRARIERIAGELALVFEHLTAAAVASVSRGRRSP
jgi:DNA-binding MarR family transcriptional regulator